MTSDTLTVILFIFAIFNSLFIGYLIGRSHGSGVINSSPQSFFSKLRDDKIMNNTISIDDKKFVTDIKTDGLERKYDTLGDIKKTEENISGSINKLKNLKR